jgi:membrane-associated phospholipid phosphatase
MCSSLPVSFAPKTDRVFLSYRNMKKIFFHPGFAFYRGSPRFWVLLSLASLCLVAFWQIAERAVYPRQGGSEDLHNLDTMVLAFAASLRQDPWNQVMIDLTTLGSFSVVGVLAISALLFLFFLRDFWGSVYLAAVLIGSAVWPNLLKPFFGRARPEVMEHLVRVSDHSFPSGHSFGAAAAYTAFAFLASRYFSRPWQELALFSFAFAIIFLVGISRVYLGVHFPSDVVAGICAGVSWAAIISALFIQPLARKK